MMLRVDSRIVQVSMRHEQADAKALQQAIGKAIVLRASADHSPRARKGAHPVYKLHAMAKLAGKKVALNGDSHSISGTVAAFHYAKHGEPNGVVLKSGEFIHTRPLGMKKLKLKVGSKVTAHGEVRVTVLGTSLVEARQVNGVMLE
jgi:hypothetical protein